MTTFGETEPLGTKRLILIDDHSIVLDSLSAFLMQQANLDVVATAENGRRGVELVKEHRPDLVITDIHMPVSCGVETTGKISAVAPDTKVMCFSRIADRQRVVGALDAGASGYLLKSCSTHELIEGIHAVLTGGVYLCPTSANTVVHAASGKLADDQSDNTKLVSPREREVIRCIAIGLSTCDIAAALNLSEKTIYTHRTHIMRKLNLGGTADITRYAIREGLVTP